MRLHKRLPAIVLAGTLLLGLAACGQSASVAQLESDTMALSQTVATMTAAADTPPFTDVPADAWYAGALEWCRENGIMSGTSATAFSPDSTMTRAMLAMVLYRAAGSPAAEETAEFTDVPVGAWCADAVAWASANRLMAGYGGGVFGANDPITREQLAAILWRYAGSPEAEAGTDYADEDSISDFAVQAVDWARSAGVISGKDGNRFDPKGGATRSQVAVILYRYLTSGDGDETPAPDDVQTADSITTNGGSTIALSSLEHWNAEAGSTVYYTSDISSEALMAIYEALEWTPTGNVAVKLSTGEPPASNYLDPNLIKDVVQEVDGTIVECNTAYGGSRASTAMHLQVAEDHGFTAIADVDIMDAEGTMSLTVNSGDNLPENIVGSHFANYDSFLVLSHFKGHTMAGFGGAIKNISIGIASSNGKVLIHSGGHSSTSWGGGTQDQFLESMGEAGKAVVDALDGQIVYISVMNRLSVDCDCDGNAAEPDMHDVGILASYDPVALDQACVDLVYAAEDGSSLVERIETRNGLHTLEHAEDIGLGSRSYNLVSID